MWRNTRFQVAGLFEIVVISDEVRVLLAGGRGGGEMEQAQGRKRQNE